MFKGKNRPQGIKQNNNGSTMLIVVVAIALISLLATVLMSMSYMNYNMKVTELNSKKNFYTAETILDQINVGLQGEVAESMEDAYVSAMQRYITDSDTTRNTNFANNFLGQLRERLRVSETDAKYEIALDSDSDGTFDKGLVQYLDVSLQQAYKNGLAEEPVKPYLMITSTDSKMESVALRSQDADGNITYSSQGLMLYNLKIEYTDTREYTSIIETDIRIKVPSLTLVTKTALPDIFDYSLVADAGIAGVTGNNVSVTFQGNVYAGKDTGSVNDAGGMSVVGNWKFDGKGRVISAGPVTIPSGAKLQTTDETESWLASIQLPKNAGGSNSGSLTLAGSTYVADDLTVEGKNAVVNLNGIYFGFGSSDTEADGSSAIILNGTNAKIDMSGLESLRLGGNAFVQTSTVTYESNGTFEENHNTNVLTGNSLAVRSDQLVYLVPVECVANGRNPMTGTQYTQLINSGVELVSKTQSIKAVGKKNISSYLDDADAKGYKTIFRKINGETLVYLYLDLPSDGAARYYQDYYKYAKTKLENYMATYGNSITVNANLENLEAKGNIISYALDGNAQKLSIIENTMADKTDDELQEILDEQEQYSKRFDCLNAKLTLEEESVSQTEMTKTVFENIINISALNSKVSSGQIKKYIIDETSECAVIANNKGKADLIYTGASGANKVNNCSIIIATGNVVIEKDFSGLIICDGKITVKNGVSVIKPDKSTVLRLLRMTEDSSVPEEEQKTLIATYFVNGDQYSLDSRMSSEVESSGMGQNMGSLIIYENWRKQ